MKNGLTTNATHCCFGDTVDFYSHDSESTGTGMNFAVYEPPQAVDGPVPVLYYLAGLTCTEETFMIKGGAQHLAAEHPLYEGQEPPKYGPARMVEVPFAVEVDGREVRGRMDALFVDEDGTFHLVDWKTGYPYESYKKRLQLPLYALAANRLWGIEPERIRLAYAFVPGDAVVEVDTSEGFLERAEDQVKNAMDRIQAGYFEPKESKYACSHCPVMGIVIDGCPAEVPEK